VRDGLGAGCLVLQRTLEATAPLPLRFRLRLALARLCTDKGSPEVALPILRDLYAELTQPVGEWDTSLVVAVAAAFVNCVRALDGAEAVAQAAVREEWEAMVAALAKLDPERALREAGA
jgi:hypothetical protein